MMEDVNLTTVIISLGGAALTYLGTKVSNKASIDKSNVENAERIYKQYQDMVGKLEAKVEKLEQEIGIIKSKYEKEIVYYQKLVEELEDEVEKLEQEIGIIKSKYEKEIVYYQKLVEELEDENEDLRRKLEAV